MSKDNFQALRRLDKSNMHITTHNQSWQIMVGTFKMYLSLETKMIVCRVLITSAWTRKPNRSKRHRMTTMASVILPKANRKWKMMRWISRHRATRKCLVGSRPRGTAAKDQTRAPLQTNKQTQTSLIQMSLAHSRAPATRLIHQVGRRPASLEKRSDNHINKSNSWTYISRN